MSEVSIESGRGELELLRFSLRGSPALSKKLLHVDFWTIYYLVLSVKAKSEIKKLLHLILKFLVHR